MLRRSSRCPITVLVPAIEFTPKHLDSFDNTQITYYVAGADPADDCQWVVIANGLGAGPSAWHHMLAYFGDQVRFVTWNYRGLADKGDLDNDVVSADIVETHVKDLQAILKAENIVDGLWIGWSFGSQVLVKMFHRDGPRPDRMVLINPCFGRRLEAETGIRRFLPLVLSACEWFPGTLERVVRRAGAWPETVSWLKRLGFVASCIDDEDLAESVRHFRTINSRALIRTLRASALCRTDGILGGIDVPTLVILGEHDAFAPRSSAEPTAKQIPHVELFVVRNGTHYTPLEHPEMVNLRVEKFVREHPS